MKYFSGGNVYYLVCGRGTGLQDGGLVLHVESDMFVTTVKGQLHRYNQIEREVGRTRTTHFLPNQLVRVS